MKKTKILNELEKAKEVYQSSKGITTWRESFLLGKYLRHQLGWGKQRIEKEIIRRYKIADPNFNEILGMEKVKDAARFAFNSPPIFDKGNIVIFQEEIDRIRQVKNFDYQLILLSMLCLAKDRLESGKRTYLDYEFMRQALSDARVTNKISFAKFNKNNVINDFKNLGMTKYEANGRYWNNKRNRRPDYIELLFYKQDGTPVFLINDFSKIREIYTNFIGGEPRWCERCGNEFIIKSNRQKYCNSCSKIIRKEKVRNNVKQYKSRNFG